MTAAPITIAVDAACTVSALFQAPASARVCYVMAHGAGAGMTHAFMHDVAAEFAAHDIATLRYQFPYTERGSKRPDAPALAHATVRAAVARAAQLMPAATLVAGGKSFGGRMTSQAQARRRCAMPSKSRGSSSLDFPLHTARPDNRRSRAPSILASACTCRCCSRKGSRDRLAELVACASAAGWPG